MLPGQFREYGLNLKLGSNIPFSDISITQTNNWLYKFETLHSFRKKSNGEGGWLEEALISMENCHFYYRTLNYSPAPGKMAQHERLWAIFMAKLQGQSLNASNMGNTLDYNISKNQLPRSKTVASSL